MGTASTSSSVMAASMPAASLGLMVAAQAKTSKGSGVAVMSAGGVMPWEVATRRRHMT